MLVTFERAPGSQSKISDIFDFEGGLERFFGDFLESPTPRLSSDYPATDVRNHEKEIVLVAELPGLQKDQVQISVHKGVLTISGERKAAELPEKAAWIRNEIFRGSFSRSFNIPRLPYHDDVRILPED